MSKPFGSAAPSKPLGRTHCSLSLMQAEQGQVLVVAASHLIFLLRQPSHALITADVRSGYAQNISKLKITFKPFVTVMFVYKHIV
jgi:hypothetical protein